MPFAYFKRLNRAQQAVYLRSDAITTAPLPRPEALRPRVAALAAALDSEERAATEAAAQQLVSALGGALRLPPVRVQVLAARPHARWGELHGLYESDPRSAAPPRITLWMRTAKQRRVVAFRTFLRTLLHEVGHHLDYAGLGLGDSFHTQGFYARESHLFHQLLADPTLAGGSAMATPEASLARLARTPDEIGAALAGAHDDAVARRPAAQAWSAKEIVCHLRDTEEHFLNFFQAVLDQQEPAYLPGETERWVEDRQYRRNDAGEALAAFRRRRAESLAFLRHLSSSQWERRGVHPARGTLTMAALVDLMARHDADHLDQLARALAGNV